MSRTVNDRTGEISVNNFGSKLKIIQYKDVNDIDVLITTIHPNGNNYEYVSKNKQYRAFKNK